MPLYESEIEELAGRRTPGSHTCLGDPRPAAALDLRERGSPTFSEKEETVGAIMAA